MSNFPPELLFDILSRLPPKDLTRFLCVSKAWYALIHDQRFIKAHLQRSNKTKSAFTILVRGAEQDDLFSLPFNDGGMLGAARKIEQLLNLERPEALGYSVNGLVCVHNDNCRDIALWNPSIQKLKKIPFTTIEPEPPYSEMMKLLPAHYGFGYDLVNDDYKLLEIAEFIDWETFLLVGSEVQIYSLKSNSWKRIQNMPGEIQFLTSAIVYLNGALSWLMTKAILTLDLATEKYQEFSTPVNNSVSSLVVLEDCLCCISRCEVRNDIWVMKEYGVTESWTLLFSINLPNIGPAIWPLNYYRPLVFSKNCEMVLLRKEESELVWFDLEKMTAEKVEIRGLPSEFDLTICVHGSLCLLDGDPVNAF